MHSVSVPGSMPPSPHGIDMLTLPILWSTQQGTRLILNLCDATAKGEMELAYLAQASPVSYSIGSIPYYGLDTPILSKPMDGDGTCSATVQPCHSIYSFSHRIVGAPRDTAFSLDDGLPRQCLLFTLFQGGQTTVVVLDLHADPRAKCCEFKAQSRCRLRW